MGQARCPQVLKDEEIDFVWVLIGLVWKHVVLLRCDFDLDSFARLGSAHIPEYRDVIDYYLCE